MRRHDLISGLFFLCLGVAASVAAYRLKLGTAREPGAGMIPFGVAGLLACMSLGLVIRGLPGLMRRQAETKALFEKTAWGRLALLVAALLAYGFALDALGFHLCTFLLMIALLALAGRKKPLRIVAVSFLTVLCVYLIFEAWLGCPFPRGFFNI